ncbi:hypothetical protein BMS3Bbin01_01956 [bacterium BMS3Bbin01]|nr:hypothetical protein BMS3Bbin01_01956 [bacterium BMS3Bbin01]
MRIIRMKHSLATTFAIGLLVAACGGGTATTSATTAATGISETTAAASETTARTPTTQSGPADGSGDLTVNTCDLLTVEEVEAAIGTLTATPEYDGSAPPMFTCSYTSEDVDLNVGAFVYPDEETAKELFQMAVASGATRIDGPGDEVQDNQPAGDLTVRSGRIELSIDLFSRMDLDQELDIAKDLASKAVPRLP